MSSTKLRVFARVLGQEFVPTETVEVLPSQEVVERLIADEECLPKHFEEFASGGIIPAVSEVPTPAENTLSVEENIKRWGFIQDFNEQLEECLEDVLNPDTRGLHFPHPDTGPEQQLIDWLRDKHDAAALVQTEDDRLIAYELGISVQAYRHFTSRITALEVQVVEFQKV